MFPGPMSTTHDQVIELIPRLRRYARALMRGDVQAADDLVQDCLERALSRLSLWRRQSDLRAWLFTIMHNLYVNRVRYSALRTRTEEAGEFAASEGIGPSSFLDMERAMNALSGDQREIILMVTLEGMSYQQVATILGVPEGTVMSRLGRARATLRRLLSGDAGVSMRVVK